MDARTRVANRCNMIIVSVLWRGVVSGERGVASERENDVRVRCTNCESAYFPYIPVPSFLHGARFGFASRRPSPSVRGPWGYFRVSITHVVSPRRDGRRHPSVCALSPVRGGG